MLKALVTVFAFLMIMTYIVTIHAHSQQENGMRKIVRAQNDSSDSFIDGKKTVRVQNDLNGGIVVYLHCQSKDDDLHQQILASGRFQQWSFRDNIGDTTLFWCNMFAYYTRASFEIYKAKVDENKCSTQCYRSVRPDGLYFYDQLHNYWEKRVSWSIPA